MFAVKLWDSRFCFKWQYFNHTPLCLYIVNHFGLMKSIFWCHHILKGLKHKCVAVFKQQTNTQTTTQICCYVCTCTYTDTHLSIKAIKGNARQQFLHSAPFCSTTSCRHAGGHTFPFIVAHKGYVRCWIIEERGGRVGFLSLQALTNVIPWQCWQFYLLCSGFFVSLITVNVRCIMEQVQVTSVVLIVLCTFSNLTELLHHFSDNKAKTLSANLKSEFLLTQWQMQWNKNVNRYKQIVVKTIDKLTEEQFAIAYMRKAQNSKKKKSTLTNEKCWKYFFFLSPSSISAQQHFIQYTISFHLHSQIGLKENGSQTFTASRPSHSTHTDKPPFDHI